MKKRRIIISGGGTGGHIFPAVAIADEFMKRNSENEILFVGAIGKMEMEKVPKAGYQIEGLPIVGLKRGFYLSNLVLPFKLIYSMWRARRILKRFKPDIVIGVGGYASGPTLKSAQFMNIATVIQEQNSFAGKTNKLLAKKALKICVAYDNMDSFFPKDKIILTGNPVRSTLKFGETANKQVYTDFNLDPTKKTLLIIGGSLGARTLNESVISNLELIRNQEDVQVIWQTGARYYNEIKSKLVNKIPSNLIVKEFVFEMNLIYSISNLIVSRAGALSVSELCLLGKSCILVPSPNVAEDHQTTNAMALVSKNAAVLIKDKEAEELLISKALQLIRDDHKLKELGKNALNLAKPNSTKDIVDVCNSILNNEK